MLEDEILRILDSIDEITNINPIKVDRGRIQIESLTPLSFHPHPQFLFRTDGKNLTQSTLVYPGQQLEWEWIGDPPVRFRYRISEDTFELYLQIIQLFTYEYWPEPLLQSGRELKFSPSQRQVNDHRLTMDELVDAANQLKIQVTLDLAAILPELEQPSGKEIRVAKGIPPIPGHDGILDLFFQEEPVMMLEEVGGKVDYKNRIKIPWVQPGEPIATYKPKKEGMPGRNVLGEIILPQPVTDLEILTDSTVTEKEGVYFAISSGRPTIRTHGKKKQLMILNQYVHHGDVSLETGNIYFSGDVVIHGNILDGMRVEAMGDIYVLENVYHADLIAGGSIFVYGTIMSSRIFAGKEALFYSLFYQKVFALNEQLERLHGYLEHMRKHYPAIDHQLPKTLVLLIDTKLPKLYTQVSNLLTQISDFRLPIPEEIKQLKQVLNLFSHPHRVKKIETWDIYQGLRRVVHQRLEEMEFYSKGDSQIHCSTGSYSLFLTSGNITITGKGTVSCQLEAQQRIQYTGLSSTSRGDRLKADEIFLQEVGTPYGETVTIQAREILQAQYIYEANLILPTSIHVVEHAPNFSWKKSS